MFIEERYSKMRKVFVLSRTALTQVELCLQDPSAVIKFEIWFGDHFDRYDGLKSVFLYKWGICTDFEIFFF